MSWKPIKEYIDYRFKPRKGNESDRALFDAWAKGKDIVRWTPGPGELIDLPRFLRTGHRYYRKQTRWGRERFELPPEIDHAVAFKSRTGKCWLTYQPYQCADALRPQVEEWAARHGLRALVYDKNCSWYYPGGTCLVVIEVPDAEKDQT